MKLFVSHFSSRLDPEVFQEFFKFVDERKKERISGFHHWEDAHRVLLADALARSVISQETGLAPDDISFDKDEFNKPWLRDFPDLYFNISHSGNWVVFAVDAYPVGVDIERILDIDLGVAEICLSPDERLELERQELPQRLYFFYALWTLKESYIKAQGRGMEIPLTDFTIVHGDDGRFAVKIEERILEDIFFKTYDIDTGYKMSVCACHDDFPPRVIKKRIDEILEGFIEG